MPLARDAAPVSSRQRTRAGFLRADATFTRPGVVEYDASDLGVGSPGETVRLRRTADSIFHPDTLASLRGAPVTLDHPKARVGPDSYGSVAVGSVSGNLQRTDDDHLGGAVLIADRRGLDAVADGVDQLSIDYEFAFEKAPAGDTEADYVTLGALDVNHVAIVAAGRAGPSVRVQDAANPPPEEITHMNKDEIAKAVEDGIRRGLASAGDSKDANGADVRAAISDALKPVTDRLTEVSDSIAEREKAEKSASLKRKAEEAAAKRETEIRTEERQRFAVLQDAQPYLSDEQRKSLVDKPVHEILAAAVGDVVDNAGDQSEDFLRGVLHSRKKSGDGGFTRPGVGNARDSSVTTAHQDYVKSLTEAWDADEKEG